VSNRRGRPSSYSALRALGIVVAVVLAVVAVVAVSFGSSTKQDQLGVIAGLWSALIFAVTFYGIRHHKDERQVGRGGELEVRQLAELESVAATAARGEYEQQLQDMVQRELAKVQRAVLAQLDELQAEVAGLRGDLVEKVGGQLRLERIETTRVIGSDIENLQHEVRRLAIARDAFTGGQDTADVPAADVREVLDVDVLRARPAARPERDDSPTEIFQAADLAAADLWLPHGFEPPPVQPIEPPSRPSAPAARETETAARDVEPAPWSLDSTRAFEPAAFDLSKFELPKFDAPKFELPRFGDVSSRPAEPAAPPVVGDPFAFMPKLSTFADDADPAPEPPAYLPPSYTAPILATGGSAGGPAGTEQNVDDGQADATVTGSGSHRRSAAEVDRPDTAVTPPAQGRRRRAEGETNDVLSRLLGHS
jgi:hypothetical protein